MLDHLRSHSHHLNCASSRARQRPCSLPLNWASSTGGCYGIEGAPLPVQPQAPRMGLHGMANPEHLAILKQGVEVWNRWREEHSPGEGKVENPNLKAAVLCGWNLERADLEFADMRRADLH